MWPQRRCDAQRTHHFFGGNLLRAARYEVVDQGLARLGEAEPNHRKQGTLAFESHSRRLWRELQNLAVDSWWRKECARRRITNSDNVKLNLKIRAEGAKFAISGLCGDPPRNLSLHHENGPCETGAGLGNFCQQRACDVVGDIADEQPGLCHFAKNSADIRLQNIGLNHFRKRRRLGQNLNGHAIEFNGYNALTTTRQLGSNHAKARTDLQGGRKAVASFEDVSNDSLRNKKMLPEPLLGCGPVPFEQL